MWFSHTISRWCTAGVLLGSAWSQVISPTNTDPNASGTQFGLVFGTSAAPTPTTTPIFIEPVLQAAVSSLPSSGQLAGNAYLIDTPQYTVSLTNQIVFIQCDSNNTSAQQNIFTSVVAAAPNAVVLFSTTSAYCAYTRGTFGGSYNNLWTTTTSSLGQQVLSSLQGTTGSNPTLMYASILSRSAAFNGANGSGNNTANTVNAPGQPSTAVAMIILYSITGVITALFLIIIVTGAIRAHRHPERYGPRNLLGRPRQSRARGLGRAILDTLPIVKFGEQEGEKPGEGDVEMAGAAMVERPRAGAATQTTPLNRGSTGTDDLPPVSPGIEELPPVVVQGKDTVENPGCSICTDDFEKGQDVRVLPCGHQFHPACIDPWLLNVSGTCPLCRVDLRPTTAQSNHTTTSNFIVGMGENQSESGSRPGSFAPPLGGGEAAAAANARSSRRMSGLIGSILNPRRMQDASREERIAALRRARDHRASQGEDEAEVRRSRRLTARLQDTFHIRTRARSGSRSGRGSPQALGEVEELETEEPGTGTATTEHGTSLTTAAAPAPASSTQH